MTSAGTVTYIAVSGNGLTLFAVHPGTGDVTTTGSLDREVRRDYSLVVRAADGGTPSLSSTALVSITVNVSCCGSGCDESCSDGVVVIVVVVISITVDVSCCGSYGEEL